MNAEKAKKLFRIRTGEQPITKFIDNLEAVEVQMIDWPNSERLARVLVNMSQASWFEDFSKDVPEEDWAEVIDDLMDGKMLAQGLEHPRFCFIVSGLSLHGTHSLVRSRIGICYMQQSQAVKDFRHSDVLVPRAYTKHPALLARYERWVMDGKQLYADMLDSGDIAVTDARFALPKTIPSWIHVSVCLSTLLGIYEKRADTQEEHPEMNIMVEKMRQLVVEKFPFMNGYFRKGCDTGKCLHTKPGYAANCIFKRDEKHQVPPSFDLSGEEETEWTLHDKTKFDLMLNCQPYEAKTIM